MLAAQPGREEEAEAAYRVAVTAGQSDGWLGVGYVLAAQPDRLGDAEAAYREAIAAGQRTDRLGEPRAPALHELGKVDAGPDMCSASKPRRFAVAP